MALTNDQKKFIIDLATRIDKDSIKRSEQDINNLITTAEKTPIKIKIDSTQLDTLQKKIGIISESLFDIFNDALGISSSKTVQGFIGIRESIVNITQALDKLVSTYKQLDDKGHSVIQTELVGFEDLRRVIGGINKEGQKVGVITPALYKIRDTLDSIAKKLDIKEVRLPERIKEEVDVAKAAVKELENSLIRLGEDRLKKNGNDSVIKYFTEMTANAQKAAEQVLSGNYSVPTSGFNRFIKELGTAMNLPNEELNKLSINIDGVEHKLVEFWNVFIENARRVKSNGELEFPTLGVKFGREGASDVQTLPILKEIDKLNEAKTALADLKKEYKDATSYVKRDFNVGLDQASIDALKEAVQSIGSINASLGEGTVLGFKPEHEQVEAVTGAFNDLKGVVQEIANILRQTFGASSISSTGIEETTNQITGATWAYTRLTGVLQQVKKEETTTASAPAFGINQDQVNSIISSLSELLELIRQIQSALVGTEAEGPLQTLTTNIQTLASSLQNFDIFKGGKSLNASQIQQVADVVLNKMKEFGSVAADDKQKVQELAEVAAQQAGVVSEVFTTALVPQGYWSNADQQIAQFQKEQAEAQKTREEIERVKEAWLQRQAALKAAAAFQPPALADQWEDKSQVKKDYDAYVESLNKTEDAIGRVTAKQLELTRVAKETASTAFQTDIEQRKKVVTGFDGATAEGVVDSINKITQATSLATVATTELGIAERNTFSLFEDPSGQMTFFHALEEGSAKARVEIQAAEQQMEQFAGVAEQAGTQITLNDWQSENINKAKEALTEAKNALIQFKEAGGDVKSDQGKQLTANVKAAQKEYDKLTNVEKYHKDLLKEIAKEQQQAASASTKSANEQKRSADQVIKTLEKQIELAEIFMAKSVENGNVDLLGERYNEFVKKVHDLKKELSDLKNDVKIGNISSEGLEKAKNSASGLKVELAGMEAAAKTAKQGLDKMADPQKIDTLIRRIETFKTVNEHLSSGTVARLDGILNTLRTSGELTDIELKKLVNDFANIGHQAAQAGEIGANWFDGWKKRLASLSQYLTTFVSFYRIVGYVRESFNIVKELDTALIDLKKTARMTAEEFEDFYFDSNKVAKEMGVTTKEIIEQASSWSRLGYNTAEAASTMAALSSKFASVSPGMGTEEAQTGLVSIMKAWDVLPENVEREVIDKINILGNRFAETNKDIIEGMERAGATLSAIGMDVQDSFALFTGAQEVIQNAETVGTAIKTLSLRIRGKYHCLHMAKAICYVI